MSEIQFSLFVVTGCFCTRLQDVDAAKCGKVEGSEYFLNAPH